MSYRFKVCFLHTAMPSTHLCLCSTGLAWVLLGLLQHCGGTAPRRAADAGVGGADTRGAFVQPALYEAFGLTVIEAMTCGLPCFATNRGGPAEIIKNGISGYHIECAPPPACA